MTQNHDYNTPSKGATDWHQPINKNFAALDRDVPIWDKDGNKGNYKPFDGAHFVATDSGAVYAGNGSSWNRIGTIGNSGPELYSQASAPENATKNDVWFDQANGAMKYYDGSSWVKSGGSGGDDSGGSGTTSDIYLDFEGSSVGEFYDLDHANRGSNFSLDDSHAHNGSQSVHCRAHEGEHYGGGLTYYFPNHDHGQPDEVYTRFYIRLEDNWQMADSSTTCKLFWSGSNLSAGGAGRGGDPPTGDDGFSNRVYCRGGSGDGDVTLATYIYHLDQDGQYGDGWNWPDPLPLGEWHQIDTYTKLNTVSGGSANRDGVHRAWLDGNLQDEQTGLRWRTTEDMGIDRVGPDIYWGGTEVSPSDNDVWFDDHRISIGKNSL
ncbi:hypothetical protein [Halorussus halophilus]|uniref:hypothetical protein n=1 Tax=Halorussus halophilus TaxID=2650975 RepID=UPI0013015B5B|nr:hypothetical protein [Halorussus halophilus]